MLQHDDFISDDWPMVPFQELASYDVKGAIRSATSLEFISHHISIDI